MLHYGNVIMGAIASQITSLTIVFTEPFMQTQIKENIKAPRHWPLCGEFADDRWIPRTNGQQRGALMTSSWSAPAPHYLTRHQWVNRVQEGISGRAYSNISTHNCSWIIKSWQRCSWRNKEAEQLYYQNTGIMRSDMFHNTVPICFPLFVFDW